MVIDKHNIGSPKLFHDHTNFFTCFMKQLYFKESWIKSKSKKRGFLIANLFYTGLSRKIAKGIT